MIRSVLAQCLDLEQGRVRVVSPDVGGAFGYKCVLQQEELCVAWLAKTFKRPFRFIEDRREHLTAGANSREHHYEMVAYADRRGKLLALDARITIDGGAYSVWPFTIGLEPGQAIGNLPGRMRLGLSLRDQGGGHQQAGLRAVPGRGAHRRLFRHGADDGRDRPRGRTRTLGNPPGEPGAGRTDALRQRHRQAPGQRRLSGQPAAGHGHDRCGRYPRAPAARRRRPPHRRGLATYTEQARTAPRCSPPGARPSFRASTRPRVTPDGGLELRVGVHSHGQGMETTFAQIANEILAWTWPASLLHGDTGQTPFSTGTYASRSLVMSGGAVSQACKRLLPRLTHIGAHLLQADAASVAGTATGWKRAASRCRSRTWPTPGTCGRSCCRRRGSRRTGNHRRLQAEGRHRLFHLRHPRGGGGGGPSTGGVEILDYVVVEDCGTMINPMVVEGQTIGGVAQGIGTAFYEETPYDDNGQPLASTLADYMLPGATEVPNMRLHHFETPSPHTEFGAKRHGRGGAISRRRCCSTRSTMRCARWARPSCCARRCRRRGCSPPSRRAAASPSPPARR